MDHKQKKQILDIYHAIRANLDKFNTSKIPPQDKKQILDLWQTVKKSRRGKEKIIGKDFD